MGFRISTWLYGENGDESFNHGMRDLEELKACQSWIPWLRILCVQMLFLSITIRITTFGKWRQERIRIKNYHMCCGITTFRQRYRTRSRLRLTWWEEKEWWDSNIMCSVFLVKKLEKLNLNRYPNLMTEINLTAWLQDLIDCWESWSIWNHKHVTQIKPK